MRKRIVFTGGGTAGHVTPNIALIKVFRKEGWLVDYIGSKHGMEAQMIRALEIPYHAIQCGKLRRYFSLKNFVDPFLMVFGIIQALYILLRLKATVVFSKGGFVAFPVVLAAWILRIPVIAHESDFTPGLANRLSLPFVRKLCLTFEPSGSRFSNKQYEVTGTPIRESLFLGNREKGLALCGFEQKKPCLLIMGGGQGSSLLNACIRQGLAALTAQYQLIHLCGKGKEAPELDNYPGYYQLGYADKELPDLLAAADIVISRAGANSVYELLALQKPHVLIPLSLKISRGDQIENALFFEKKGISVVLDEEAVTVPALIASIDTVNAQKASIRANITALNIGSATEKIADIIKCYA